MILKVNFNLFLYKLKNLLSLGNLYHKEIDIRSKTSISKIYHRMQNNLVNN